jgi:hypothetical protein
MSLVSWYRRKADQCSLMAKDVTDPRTRANCEETKKQWLDLAEQIEPNEGSELWSKLN